LNGVCAYFTMFPLSFPYDVLRAHAEPGDVVLDPFCGRGTTNYASRLLELASFGIDSSPVATALSQAKLANASPDQIVSAATAILRDGPQPADVPQGEFWDWAFDRAVLRQLCTLRESLLADCASDARKALRAIVMGALHGPRTKAQPSYFSNQAPRTYAPKPRYAVGFWKRRNLRPEPVDVLGIIETRAVRYYGRESSRGRGAIAQADSRCLTSYVRLLGGCRPHWIITSPPYYGMRMYRPDQWLRGWFVGSPARVDYSSEAQLAHTGPRVFVSQLRRAWRLAAEVCAPRARMVVRFGGIRDRKAEPLALVLASFADSRWKIASIRSAGCASSGKRQALHFTRPETTALEEHDVWAVREA
jgi:DNA methylase